MKLKTFFCIHFITGKKAGLTEEERGQIVALRKANYSIRKIAKELNRSRCVIKCFLDNPDSYGKKYVGERSKKLSKQSQRRLIREASRGEYSCKQLKDKLDLDVHVRTISNYLNSSGQLKYEMRKRAPALKSHYKEKRLLWAKQMVNYNERWECMVFSDEKKFNLDGPDGYKYYWHDLRKEKDVFSRKHGGGSVMVWGGISAFGKTELVFLKGRQDSQKYIEMLKDHLLPFVETKEHEFQQDNAPIHVSKATRDLG